MRTDHRGDQLVQIGLIGLLSSQHVGCDRQRREPLGKAGKRRAIGGSEGLAGKHIRHRQDVLDAVPHLPSDELHPSLRALLLRHIDQNANDPLPHAAPLRRCLRPQEQPLLGLVGPDLVDHGLDVGLAACLRLFPKALHSLELAGSVA